MGKVLFLLFTVVPLVELYLLLAVGRALGPGPTLVMVVLTGVVGAALAKSEGLRVVQRWRDAVSQGRMPEEGVLSGLLVLVGGVLLIAPGVLTDITGLLLLVPVTRRWIAAVIRARFERSVRRGQVRITTFGMWPREAAAPEVERFPTQRRPPAESDAEIVEDAAPPQRPLTDA